MDQNTTPDLALNAIDMSGKKRVKTIHIDWPGDLKLRIATGENEFAALVVSSKAMSIACGPWKVILRPNFIEGQPVHKVIPLEDDLEAMVILLRIAHLQFTLVPTTLGFCSLLQVAVLTDKYQATPLVVPWVHKWMQDLEHLVEMDGHEEWLWIAWEYGREDIFKSMVDRLVLECTTKGGTNCANKNGRILKDFMLPGIIGMSSMCTPITDPTHFPIPIFGVRLENILEARETKSCEILHLTCNTVQNYIRGSSLPIASFLGRSEPWTPQKKKIRRILSMENHKYRDATQLGSLILELYRIGLWLEDDSGGVNISI